MSLQGNVEHDVFLHARINVKIDQWQRKVVCEEDKIRWTDCEAKLMIRRQKVCNKIGIKLKDFNLCRYPFHVAFKEVKQIFCVKI